MTSNTGKEYILFNFCDDFLRVGQKNCPILRRKIVFKTTAATQLSVIGQMTSSTFSALCYWAVDVILYNIRVSVQGAANQNTVF